MSAAMNPQVDLLFIKSAEDEDVLAFAVADAVFEFHVQQAIEKLLKALIAAHSRPYPFTHDLDTLIALLEDLGEVLPDFGMPLQGFTPFGVLVRYDHGAPLTTQERDHFREVVAEVNASFSNACRSFHIIAGNKACSQSVSLQHTTLTGVF